MDALDALISLSTLVFVVSSMVAMGLGLTLRQIGAALTARFAIVALVVNFLVVPALAYGIDLVLDLDESLFIGLVIVSVAGGAPFLPKLAQAAKGDVAAAVGLMVLLMVTTVVVMPLALPLLLEGVSVSAWDIASSLIFLMILPLAVALWVRSRYQEWAEKAMGGFGTVSSVALAFLVVGSIISNWESMVSLVGTRGILAGALLIAAALAVGYVAGGEGKRSVLGLGTAQRNLSAAFVVAVQNFGDDPDVLSFVIVVAIVGLAGLLLTAAELGRRSEAAA